ncbi:MAG TPA: YtxH domain-containing protein [Candidatus Angelobacter sp.]|jgi:gas vesicle protein|nr:YtxH domain-containing protein [Candidatus Angelobacter sp.]
MSDNRNNIGWFLAGLGLGAAVAILYAPKSGRETRQAIVTGVDDGREYLTSVGRNARDQISDWVASGKKIVTGKKQQVSAAIDAGRDAMRNAAEKSS